MNIQALRAPERARAFADTETEVARFYRKHGKEWADEILDSGYPEICPERELSALEKADAEAIDGMERYSAARKRTPGFNQTHR